MKTYPLIFTTATFVLLLIACVLQVNAYAQEVYLIKIYEKELRHISQENKILEIGFASVNSLENIGNYLKDSNFGKIKQAEYARVFEGTAMAK